MAVPGHDQRDFEFAIKYKLPIVKVVDMNNVSIKEEAYTDEGVVVNSGFLDGLTTNDAKEKMIKYLEAKNIGKRMTTYRLKDWLI